MIWPARSLTCDQTNITLDAQETKHVLDQSTRCCFRSPRAGSPAVWGKCVESRWRLSAHCERCPASACVTDTPPPPYRAPLASERPPAPTWTTSYLHSRHSDVNTYLSSRFMCVLWFWSQTFLNWTCWIPSNFTGTLKRSDNTLSTGTCSLRQICVCLCRLTCQVWMSLAQCHFSCISYTLLLYVVWL